MELEIVDDPSPELVDHLSTALYEHNCRVSGTRDLRKFAILKRSDDGAIEGGASGWTRWGWIYLDLLWVEESHRGRGIGRAMVEATELLGRRRGCSLMTVDTASFQAPDFYRKLGFQEMFALDIPRHGIRKFQFRKDLQPLPDAPMGNEEGSGARVSP